MATTWKVAGSLDQLLDQLNELAPNRSKASDGGVGDLRHSTRASDHNPWWEHAGQPYVTARDFTNDPAGGLDCTHLAEALRDSKDKRVKYLIWADRIMSGFGGPAPWVWRPYQPTNQRRNRHLHHLHLSVMPDPRSLTRTPWRLPGLSGVPPQPSRPTIRRGDTGTLVGIVQRFLGCTVDEVFGEATERAVIAYQRMRGLEPDGIVGIATWRSMGV